MNLNTLQEFRHEMYNCFGNAKDALFNLVDALCSEAGASSFPELSFSPFFERTWASLYEALEDGQIDAEAGRVQTDLLAGWTTPFALTIGALALTLCAVLAAVNLIVEAQIGRAHV